MSDNKWTDGPWLIAPEDKAFVYALGPKGTNVFWFKVYAAGMERASKEECEANANLIAAAPDMYEELQDISSQLSCECGHKSCSIEAQRRDIEAVLAKARGES